MTTTTLAPAASPVRPATIGVANLMRSEWTKLRSLRSTYWTAIVAVIAAIGITIIGALEFVQHFAPDQLEGFDAANFSVQGLYLSQIALGALGVMTITGEYATGMIRTTLTAVPQRRVVIAIKGLVYLIAIFMLSEVMSFASFGIGQAILHRKHAGVSLSDPNVLRVVFGSRPVPHRCRLARVRPGRARAPDGGCARERSSACCSCPRRSLICCRVRGTPPQ